MLTSVTRQVCVMSRAYKSGFKCCIVLFQGSGEGRARVVTKWSVSVYILSIRANFGEGMNVLTSLTSRTVEIRTRIRKHRLRIESESSGSSFGTHLEQEKVEGKTVE